MRIFLPLLFLVSCAMPPTILSEDRQVYKVKMSVLETDISGSTTCFEDIEVYWGIYHDTLAFHYQGLSIQFHSVSKKTWRESKVKRVKVQENLNKMDKQSPKQLHYVLQDQFDEKYFIMIDQTPISIIVGIGNMERGYPSYMFCQGCSKFCN